MKLLQLLGGLAASALVGVSAVTAANVNYEPGELLMGFRATSGNGATKSYLVNLGPAANYTGASTPFVVQNLGNIKADLDATFGGWQNDATVFWSISGANSNAPSGTFAGEPARTLFVTKAQSIPGTLNAQRWVRNTSSGQAAPAGKILDMANAYEFVNPTVSPSDPTAIRNSSTANSPMARLQNTTDINSYAAYQPGGANLGTQNISYAYFDPTIEGTFANGTTNSILELYRLKPGSTGTPGDFVGTFQLDDNGNLTFTPIAAPDVKFASAIYSAAEGGVVTVTVARSGDLAPAFSVNVNTVDGSGANAAVAGTDYTAIANLALNFAAQETTKTFDITLANRAGFQNDRVFKAALSGATNGARLASPSEASITVQETETAVALDSATYTVAENSGSVAVKLVRKGSAAAFSATVNTGGGTAGPSDYTALLNTSVDFAVGDTEKTVNISVANRTGVQGDRTFDVTISAANNGVSVVAPTVATVTITDQVFPGTLAFAAAAQTVEPVNVQGLPAQITLPVVRTGGVDGTATVDVSVTGGTLVSGTDYDAFANPTQLSFGQGVLSQAVTIQLKALSATRTGTIILGLANPGGGATLGSQTTITVTILSRDFKKPTVKLTAPKAGLLAAGVTTFDVTGTASDDRGIDHVEVTINGVVTNVGPGAGSGGSASFALNGIAAENGNNTVSVVAVDLSGNRSVAQKRTVLYVNKRPNLAGTYTGLLVPAVAPSHNTSGLVSLKVTVNGIFTGKVNLGAFSLPISGIVANDGALHFKPAYGAQLALVGRGRVPTQFGTISMILGADKVTGTLVSVDGTTTLANLDGDRAVFDGITNLVDAEYLNVNGKSGFYTVVLPSEEQSPVLGHELYPQGDGIGVVTMTSKGIVKLKGTLADGTPVSASAPMSQAMTVPLYSKLYKNLGSIAGTAQFDKTQPDSDVTSNGLLWIRPQITGKYYPAGWTGLKVGLVGTRYAAPLGASALPNLLATGAPNGNATISFSDGKLTANPLTKNVDISAANKVTVLPAGTKEFTLKITAPSGALSGAFTHSDGSKTAYKGAILRKGANSAGFGYFLSTVPKNSVVTGESGGVTLIAW